MYNLHLAAVLIIRLHRQIATLLEQMHLICTERLHSKECVLHFPILPPPPPGILVILQHAYEIQMVANLEELSRHSRKSALW